VPATRVVEELHALLSGAGIASPYVLGGWSFGGFFVRLYTKRYPGEVVGLVSVDGTPAGLPPGRPDIDLVQGDRESFFMAAADAELAGLPDLGARPLVVLTRGRGEAPADQEALWLRLQKQLARLSTSSILARANEAGHAIQFQAPGLTAEAFRQVIAAARTQSPLPPCASTPLPRLGATCLDAAPVNETRRWENSADSGPAPPLRPGAKVRGMTLTRAPSTRADAKLFDFCNPVILRPGTYRRSCSVPRVRRLFVGYGAFDADPAKLDADWKASRWDAWLDGRRVALPAFGTFDRILYAFPPAGGRDATLREWRVMLVNPTRGRHTVRYRLRGPVTGAEAGTIDATFIFSVRG
jgi:hypothetical protein